MENGTEKQISWAMDIRDGAFAQIDELLAPNKIGKELGRRGVNPQRDIGVTDLESMHRWINTVSESAKSIDDATWWIEHRDSAGFEAVQRVLDEVCGA